MIERRAIGDTDGAGVRRFLKWNGRDPTMALTKAVLEAFPAEFRWGTATAAYQIEGAVQEGGRGPSVWDTFSHTPGKTFRGETGDVACDHYHQYAADFRLLRSLGIRDYRLSIAWPRIFPTGRGPVNPQGVDFYDRLLDTLQAEGITPAVTLYHWDLPQALEDQGGWRNRDTVFYFRDYAGELYRRFGDRVPLWITHNEPWCTTFLGHVWGEHAPGYRDPVMGRRVAHHALLSHGLAVEAFRESGREGMVGITLNLNTVYPASERDEDRTAAELADVIANRAFLDPLFKGAYPELLDGILPPVDGLVHPEDMAIIQRPIDFLGVNYYSYQVAAADPEDPKRVKDVTPRDDVTDMGWPINPQGLTDLLLRLSRDFTPVPLYVTENGAAYPDRLEGDRVQDAKRVAYLERHVAAMAAALRQGVDLRGYYLWSFLDNFEWAFGYSKRFGIVYVDYPTQRRIPKDSAYWYRDLIEEVRTAR